MRLEDGESTAKTIVKNKQLRRDEAEERQEKYDNLTHKQKLTLLDSRRGESRKERKRLERTK